LFILGGAGKTAAATLTLQTNVIGVTPEILAYNSGHFYTNSNTRDWWRYAGVNGARVFVSPSDIEASDDLAPVGDGVTNQSSFVTRKTALRADPLNPIYINWSYFSNRYETVDLGASGNNHLRVNYCCRELRKLGIQICAQITANSSRLPIISANDWAGKWELWQHFYAQAFYLGRTFDVQRYQMYNEPDAVPLAADDFLQRLQLASDAIQSALADVNSLFGKTLTPLILAPVNAGTASSDTAQLGGVGVTNRHLNFLGVTDTNWLNLQRYDYHQYSGGPSGFGADLNSLRNYLASAMAPETPFKTTISEFNTHTGATFDTLTNTLDTATEYAAFGGICVALVSNQCSELYAFKFSQTDRAGGTYPVAKNAMHYVDNNNSPYNVGGITRAGEVYRLFNKAFATGRDRLNSLKGSGATSFETHASYDAARKRYYFFSVNDTASGVAIDFAFTNLPVPIGNRALLEEVSDATYGSGKLWTSVTAGKTIAAGTQPANSVWLLTLPAEPQATEQILTATDDAEVRDGTNATVNFGSATNMTARNDPTNTANRSAAFMKFDLTGIAVTNIEFAILSLPASTISSSSTAQAHVYALDMSNWSQTAITWSNAPNLKPNVTAGNTIAKQFVTGAGDTAHIVGQVVVNSTSPSEKLIDVTDWLRTQTNAAITFLVSQDPRWDVALPSLATGDTQPDGVKILTTESGSGPRLRVVLKSAFASSNTPPVATNDTYAATEDILLTVNAPGVLANDFDAETNTLTAVLVTPPLHGTLSLNTNGGFTYLAATNFNGTDSFTYKANDGAADSSVATVTLNIAAVNDPPVAQNDDASATQNLPVIISVLNNDTDVDGGTLAIVSFTQGTNGVVSNNGNGTLTYTPNLNFLGTDAFTYTITDGQGGTNSATVNLSVTTPSGGTPYWTNLLATTEAFIRGGANAAADQDEVATGYIMVKYNATPFDNSRKAYFQFNLTGLNVAANTAAVFTVGFLTNNKQNVQLWALNQAYPSFTTNVTWNTAQANDTASNDLLTSGGLNASPIGGATNIPASGTTPQPFTIPLVANFVRSNWITLAISGVNLAGNDAAGLRILRTNATLQVLIVPLAPATNPPPRITGIAANPNGSLVLNFTGATNATFRLLATTNLIATNWTSISTNVSNANGGWSYTNFDTTNFPQRF
jgi:VCBS repeat-containing protein